MKAIVSRLFHTATVAEVGWATPRTRAITLTADEPFRCEPGQQVRIATRPLDGLGALRSPGDLLRTYSVWSHDEHRFDLRVLVHGDAPGSNWARDLTVGDRVHYRGPEGDFVVNAGSSEHLFVGDDTACAAFGAMAAAAEGRTVIVGLVPEGDRLPLPGEVRWASPEEPLEALRAAAVTPGTAYLAGEARTIQRVRGLLIDELGWARRQILTKPFWTPGKTGME